MKGRKLEPTLTIRFKPVKEDYILASRALGKKSPLFLSLAALVFLAMVGAVVVLIFPAVGNPAWQNIALIVLLVGVFYIIYYIVLIPMQLSRAYQSNAHLQSERHFTFTDQHIRMKIGENATELAWENIKQVIDGGQFYLLIYQADERVYPFIPKRAFADDETQRLFLQMLESKSIKVK
jgi:hypothetical protein